MKLMILLGAAAFAMPLAAKDKTAAPAVVSHVDLDRYLGTWYEISTIPARFQKDCVAVSATYTRRADGRIDVVNACRVKTLDGRFKSVRGRAWVVDPATNAKLKVQFFWPFRGDYWILELDPEYGWVVVGSPDRKYLWILGRRRTMDPALYGELVSRAAAKGFDTAKLRPTPQPPEPER